MAKEFIPLTPLLTAPPEPTQSDFQPLSPLVSGPVRPEGVPESAYEAEPGVWRWSENTDGPGGFREFRDPNRAQSTGSGPLVFSGPVLQDTVKGAIRGGGKAISETLKAAGSATDYLGSKVVDALAPDTEQGRMAAANVKGEWSQAVAGHKENITKAEEGVLPDAPKTGAGAMAESISQFTVGMIGAGKFLRVANLLQKADTATTLARGAVEGALVDAFAFDPFQGRLSNLIEQHPSLSNPVTEYLQAKPGDSEAEGRFKNAIEGLGLGMAVEGFLRVVKAVKGAKDIAEVSGREAGLKELEKAFDAIDAEVALQKKAPAGGVEAPKELSAKPQSEPTAKALLSDRAVESVIRDAKADVFISPNYVEDLWRHDKIDAAGGVKVVLETVAEGVREKITKATGGVQTWNETIARSEDFAESLGLKSDEFMANLSVLAKDADKQAAMVLTARRIQTGLATEITEMAKKLDLGVEKDRTKINASIQKLAELESILAPIRTAQARGTRQWGIITDDLASQQTIKMIIASGGDPLAVSKLLRPQTVGQKALNYLLEYRINSLLSGPKTQIVNLVSNMLMTAVRPLERVIGGDVHGGLAEYAGVVRGLWDSVKLAAKAFKLEESILDPLVVRQEVARFATSANALGLRPNSPMGKAVDWLGTVIRLPSRFLTTGDELFKQLNYRASAYAVVTKEASERGLKGLELANYIETRFQEFFENGKGIDPAALREAKISTFQEDLIQGSIAASSASFISRHPTLRLIMPFVKTPINILKQATFRTPGINLLLESYRGELKAGGSRAARARGQLAFGGILWGSAIALALSGRITGRGPSGKDHQKRQALMLSGWRAYSIKVGNKYIGYDRLDPWGAFFGIAADVAELGPQTQDRDFSDLAIAATAALARNLTSKTYLRGLSEALDAFSDGDPKATERWFASMAGSFVPSGAQQVAGLAGLGDEYLREVRSTVDAMMAKIPGLSETLPLRRNILGEPIRVSVGIGPDSISPIQYSEIIDDTVKQELASIGAAIAMPPEKIREGRIDLTAFVKDGQDAYDRLLELRLTLKKGRYTLHEALDRLIKSDRYQRLPDGTDLYTSQKVKEIQATFGEFSEWTMKQLRREYPELDKAIKTDEQNQRMMKRPQRASNPVEDFLRPLVR